MSRKIKNIIIFLVIVAIAVSIYIFYIKASPDNSATPLVSSTPFSAPQNTTTPTTNIVAAGDFLTLLLSVKNIKLDNAIFSDVAFASLHDSSISLTADGTEGRTNPFAPLGADASVPPVTTPANSGSANTGTSVTH